MVDVHRDSGLTDHRRLNALKARRMEVRKIAVVAKAKRHRFRRRADDGIGPEIVMRRRDREGRRREMRRQYRIYLTRTRGRNVSGNRDHSTTAFARKKATAGVYAAGMSVPRAL